MTIKRFASWSSAVMLCASAGIAAAQTHKEIEPVVPVGPPVTPVAEVPTGPTVQPVVPVESLRGVDTVTLDTPRGPVVVVSWPTSAGPAALSPDNNIEFGRVDSNDDGYITRQELTAAAPGSAAAGRLANRFEAMDTNRDGRLDTQEILVWVHR
ncbi:EF-hand domain-containing protein [Luteimonas sp. RD2P54]|uniref:EF-hand domain-containing protein n=1 Tax=Luteimonas endophytica TaxID=3042023 RepID=A0ABT6JAI0_9GAMM|nr:EF-hand domain-containing protein [Luteimonas endophytica]MDH5823597.1 EF-hand domain-containing protein [Luteimonas endophytica]